MFAKTAIPLVLLVGIASSVLGAPVHAQTASIPDQKLSALAAAIARETRSASTGGSWQLLTHRRV